MPCPRCRNEGMQVVLPIAPIARARYQRRMTQTNDRILLGTLLMLGFCATAPLIDVAAKLAAQTVPVGQITVLRFVVQGLIMLPAVLMTRNILWPAKGTWGRLFWRSFFLLTSTYCFVAAVRVMPIADALAIVFVEPFLLLILGKFLFADSVGPRRIGASVVGFVGCVMVIQPSLQVFGLVALYPLGTAASFAGYMLVTRSLSRSVHPISMQFQTSAISAAIGIPALLLGGWFQIPTLVPMVPNGLEWVWICGVGLASAVAHMLMTYALRYAPSATLAPLHYLEIVSALILGYLIFDDFPNLLALIGTGIIIGSGLYVIYRERVASRDQSVTMPPPGSEGMA